MQTIRCTGLLLLILVPLAGSADTSGADAVFSQLPEDIQNRILSEAADARSQCNAATLRGAMLYDCNCVGDKVRDARIMQGPGTSASSLYSDAFAKGSECLQPDKVQAWKRQECVQSFASALAPRPADQAAFCNCYAGKFTERFVELPAFNGSYLSKVHGELWKTCDYNQYYARVKAQLEAAAPPAKKPAQPVASAEPLSPWPWEWLRLELNPEEMDQAFRQAAGLKSGNQRPCQTGRYCRMEFVGTARNDIPVTIKGSFSKSRLGWLQFEIRYPVSMEKDVIRRLSASVSESMLKQYPNLDAAKQSACNTKRSSCNNLPDGRDWQGNEMFRSFMLRRRGNTFRLSLEYRPLRRESILPK